MKRIWVDRDKCLGCKSCELSCAVVRDSVSKTLFGAVRESERPQARVAVHGASGAAWPLQCRHCDAAPCILACPAGAMQRDEDSRAVFVDAARCRGCYMCVMTCPFGCVVPSVHHQAVVKCDLCLHREEQACVAACPTGALLVLDEAGMRRVLAKRRDRIALFAQDAAGDAPLSLEYQREGE